MPRSETLRDVPAEDVSNIVDSFIADGAKEINLTKQGNGKWTITAEFP